MQYTYEEAVRELSDFIGKNATADNYWKMEQILLTVLRGDDGCKEALCGEWYSKGYEAGVAEERDSWSCK